MNDFDAKLELVTPAFLGGSDGNASTSDGLRPPTLKGLLRFWWRAMHGNYTLKDLAEKEAEIFGSTDEKKGQGLRIIPLESKVEILPRGSKIDDSGGALGYLGYGPIGYQKKIIDGKEIKANWTLKDALNSGSNFRFKFIHRQPAALSEIQKALWLLSTLGGIGSRSRRGWGSLKCIFMNSEEWLSHISTCSDDDKLIQYIKEGIDIACPLSTRESADKMEWTAIGKDSRILISFNRSWDRWGKALVTIGNCFRDYRHAYGQNGRSGRFKQYFDTAVQPGPDYDLSKKALTSKICPANIPERAAFGLPYAQEYRSLSGQRAEYEPEGEKYTRRASPLMFHIGKFNNGCYYVVVSFLPAIFVPTQIEAKGKNGEFKGFLSSPSPTGLISASGSKVSSGKTLVTDFLDQLRYKEVSL